MGPAMRDKLKQLGLKAPNGDGAAQLVYDIETAPAMVYTWDAFDTNIIATERDWSVLMFSYKWLNQGAKAHPVAIWHNPKYVKGWLDDQWAMERLHALFDAADVIIAHNGDRFDRRKANARFLFHGMEPPSPYQQVDTLKVARREFANYKNSLDELGRVYLDERKAPSGTFETLWKPCMIGDEKAQRRMVTYANRDVVLLEKWYNKVLPWMGMPGKPGAPNLGHWSKGDLVCPKCGNSHVQINRWDKLHRTSASEFPTVKCIGGCGGYSRLRNRISQRNGDGVHAI